MAACRTIVYCIKVSLQGGPSCIHPTEANKVSRLAQLQQRCMLQCAPFSITAKLQADAEREKSSLAPLVAQGKAKMQHRSHA